MTPDPSIRRATLADADRVVRLANAGGPEGRARKEIPDPLPPGYVQAFRRINADPAQFLMVAEVEGTIVGTFHLTYLTYLAGEGREDAQIEAVHVAASHRRRGIGGTMMAWVIAHARARGCRRIQLTTDKRRRDAHRFYERLGFQASHEGMKLPL